jgi:lysophospholipase L1-like esterase
MVRIGRVLAIFVAAMAAWALAAASAGAATWVGLGDSYAAGPVIPNQIPPYGCLKSDHNFAHLAAAQLGYTLTDASCSGATTGDMTSAQGVSPGPNPPQFDSLTPTTDVVTLEIGGNDIGFSEIIQNCATVSPFGHPCQDHYVVNGDDQISDRINATAPKVAAVLAGIHQRSPNARVFVVNYAAILPETGVGCYPQMPLAWDDVPYLRAKEKELNAMLANQAAAGGATLVDDYTASIGHDACQLPLTRWVEPMAPNAPAAPVHPNAQGMAGIAKVVAAAVGQ